MVEHRYLVLCLLLLALVGGCTTGRPPQQATSTEVEKPPEGKAAEGQWLTSLDEGLKQASQQGKPLVVDFFATWCGPCKMLDEQTWPDQAVAKALEPYVAVRVDIDKERSLAEQYRIEGVPTIIFMDSAGKERRRQVGFLPPDEMAPLLTQYGSATKATK